MKKTWYKKWWVWLIIAVIVIGIGSSSEEQSDSVSATLSNKKDGTVEVAESKPEVKEFYGLGEEVKLGDSILIVNTVEKSAGSEWDKPKSGNEYVIVNVTIKNAGDSEISYNPYDFSMQNSQGQITDSSFTMIDSDTSLSSGSLASGGEITGTISFEQPIDDEGLILKYSTNIFSSKEVKVKLN